MADFSGLLLSLVTCCIKLDQLGHGCNLELKNQADSHNKLYPISDGSVYGDKSCMKGFNLNFKRPL